MLRLHFIHALAILCTSQYTVLDFVNPGKIKTNLKRVGNLVSLFNNKINFIKNNKTNKILIKTKEIFKQAKTKINTQTTS